MSAKTLGITYDIACQFKVNFWKRIDALPDALKNLDLPPITWGLPVWHGNVHDMQCEAKESVKYKPGMGKTDGEGPERIWSLLNPMSYITKEEQPGARQDDHEDKINSISWRKNIGAGECPTLLVVVDI